LTISYSHKPAKANVMFSQWWRPLPDGWKPTLCPMPLPGIPSWALKSKSYGDMAPLKELSGTTGLIFARASDTWAKEHGIEWVYRIPYNAPASGKVERYNGLIKTTLRATRGGTFKN